MISSFVAAWAVSLVVICCGWSIWCLLAGFWRDRRHDDGEWLRELARRLPEADPTPAVRLLSGEPEEEQWH